MSEHTLKELSQRLDQLVAYCEQLQEDNHKLHQREQDWLQERVRLIEKSELARSRVEAMISHLKSLQEGVG